MYRLNRLQTTKFRRGLAVQISVALLAAGVVHPAQAHDETPIPIDAMTRHAEWVVEAVVQSVGSAWNADRTQIHTTISLRLDRVYKGDPAVRTLELRQLGGTVGNITMYVFGEPRFVGQERVLLFVSPRHRLGEFPIVGGARGKLKFVRDPKTGDERLQNSIQSFEPGRVRETVQRVAAELNRGRPPGVPGEAPAAPPAGGPAPRPGPEPNAAAEHPGERRNMAGQAAPQPDSAAPRSNAAGPGDPSKAGTGEAAAASENKEDRHEP